MPENAKAARVRELCRRLKPIIGSKADHIWKAYLVETETGKAQVLEYLELLAAQHFDGDLEQDDPMLQPPSREHAQGEYELGHVSYHDRQLFPFGLRENEWIQHVGVFGRSGAGKTNLGFWLIERLIEHNKPVLIFDWKRNYRDLLNRPGFENLAVYTVGREAAPLSFNPLIPPPETPPKTWLKKLIAVIAHSYLLGNGVLYVLQETLDQVYDRFGVYSGSIDRWPTFHDVQDALKQRQSSGREAGWLTSALRAMASLTFGDMESLINRDSSNLNALLERPVVIELDALTQSDKVFFVQAMLLWIHHHRMSEGTRERFKHAILIEEAHHVLSGERRSLVGGQSVMELTAREIREFGESLIILDQHPSQIAMPSLANTYATFCFNLKHRSDVNAMSQAMLLQDEERQLLGTLPTGQAVARLQGRGPGPFTIDVPEYPITKGSVTDAAVRHQMLKLGLLSVRQPGGHGRGSTEPTSATSMDASMTSESRPAPPSSPFSPDSADTAPRGAAFSAAEPSSRGTLERTLLQDIAAYPDAGIAERYQRLAVSVRQGQKIKKKIIEQGLAHEQLETTQTGKRRVVRLTEQGRLSVAEAEQSGASDGDMRADRTKKD